MGTRSRQKGLEDLHGRKGFGFETFLCQITEYVPSDIRDGVGNIPDGWGWGGSPVLVKGTRFTIVRLVRTCCFSGVYS